MQVESSVKLPARLLSFPQQVCQELTQSKTRGHVQVSELDNNNSSYNGVFFQSQHGNVGRWHSMPAGQNEAELILFIHISNKCCFIMFSYCHITCTSKTAFPRCSLAHQVLEKKSFYMQRQSIMKHIYSSHVSEYNFKVCLLKCNFKVFVLSLSISVLCYFILPQQVKGK